MALLAEELTFVSADGKTNVFARVWRDNAYGCANPAGAMDKVNAEGREGALGYGAGAGEAVQPVFLLQIAHGMCEYIDRYAGFAAYVAAHGGVVFGNDHLGHGNTKDNNPGSHYGYFADKDGEKLVVADLHQLTVLMQNRFPGLPLFLMGHSMGSMLCRDYVTKYPDEAVGAIFSGTSGTNKLTGLIRFLARVGFFFGRAKKPAHMLSYLAFSKYNDKYEDVKSQSDWISRDREIVDAYLKDPRCTFKFTDRAAYDFANLMDSVSGAQWARRIPKDLPYLLISGTMDPVGEYTAGVKEVYGHMKDAGVADLQMKLYEGARHEILNEINRQEVYADIQGWIDAHMPVK